jgi:hypothetical protein
LFTSIVAIGGYRIGYLQFLKHGACITPVVMAAATIAIGVEQM